MSQISMTPLDSEIPLRSVPLDLPMPAIIFDQIGFEPVNSMDEILPPINPEPPKIRDEPIPGPLYPYTRSNRNKNRVIKKYVSGEEEDVTATTKRKAKKMKKNKQNSPTLGSSFSVTAWFSEHDNDTRSNQEIDKNLTENFTQQQNSTLVDLNEIKPKTKSIKSKSLDGKPKQTNNNENIRNIPCQVENCKKMFCTQSALRKHSLTHGPKQYECTECKRAFVEKSKLKRHQLVHTGNKPFVCRYEGCYKRFSLDYNLKTHLRIHTGDRPYVCPMDTCKKRYAKVEHLRSHMVSHAKPNEKTSL